MIHIADYGKFRRARGLWMLALRGSTEAERAAASAALESLGAACATFGAYGRAGSLGRALRWLLLRCIATRLGFIAREEGTAGEGWVACGPPAAILSLRAAYAAADLMLALALADWHLPLDCPAGIAYLSGILSAMVADLSLPPEAMVPRSMPEGAADESETESGGDLPSEVVPDLMRAAWERGAERVSSLSPLGWPEPRLVVLARTVPAFLRKLPPPRR